MKRRDLLKFSAASLSYFTLLPSFAARLVKPGLVNQTHNKKLVWIILRGGLDSLHSTMPVFDKDFLSIRQPFIAPIKDQLLPVDRGFALHPSLAFMHSLYEKKQLNMVVATATPYRERSHFSAQDMLECGLATIDEDNGWLARVTSELSPQTNSQALAVARSLPVSMRGNNDITTWYPSYLKSNNDDLYERLMQLYEYEEDLSQKLEQAVETQALVKGTGKHKQRGKLPNLAQSCATLMSQDNGPNIAMLEMSGWDTHNRQTARLNNQLNELDSAVSYCHRIR